MQRPPESLINLPASWDAAGKAVAAAADAARATLGKWDAHLDNLTGTIIADAWKDGFLMGALTASVLMIVIGIAILARRK